MPRKAGSRACTTASRASSRTVRGRSNTNLSVLGSPCDALVGACGRVHRGQLCCRPRAFPTRCSDLLGDPELVHYYRNGRYATLRLTSSMCHRFHAPHDCPSNKELYFPATPGTSIPSHCGAWKGCFARTSARSSADGAALGGGADAGAGRRHPGSRHPSPIPRCAVSPREERTQFYTVRCLVPQGGGNGLVRAWLDHHRLRAARFAAVRTLRGGVRIQMGQALMLQGSAMPRQRDGNGGEHGHSHGDAIVDLFPYEERGPSATSKAISTPRLIGPGCMTNTLGEASSTRSVFEPNLESTLHRGGCAAPFLLLDSQHHDDVCAGDPVLEAGEAFAPRNSPSSGNRASGATRRMSLVPNVAGRGKSVRLASARCRRRSPF